MTGRRPKGSECECIGCGEFFGSPSAFDRHIAPVGCRPPAECRNKKTGTALFDRTERKGGPTWVLAGERPDTWGGATAPQKLPKRGRGGRCRRSYERMPGELNLCPTCRDDRSIRERMRTAQNGGTK